MEPYGTNFNNDVSHARNVHENGSLHLFERFKPADVDLNETFKINVRFSSAGLHSHCIIPLIRESLKWLQIYWI